MNHRPPMHATGWLLVVTVLLLPGAPAWSQARAAKADASPDGVLSDAALQELSRQVNNPNGPLWQLTFDNSVLGLARGGLDGVEPSYTGSFEPQGPVWQGRPGAGPFGWAEELAIFARLTLPIVETVPLPRGSGQADRETGFGDIQLGGILGPKRRSGFIYGIGPTFIFPSASDDALGQGKWQAGPAAVAGYMGKKWIAYVIVQQWWSFAGSGGRADTNQLNLNYVLLRSLPRGWQVGTQPSLTVDWTASSGNAVSFPVGLGFGRTVQIGGLAVQFWVEFDYYAVRPDNVSAPQWGIDMQITPVIAELF